MTFTRVYEEDVHVGDHRDRPAQGDPHGCRDRRDEQPIATLGVVADRCQTERLLAWAASFGLERTWAIESANGLGKLLAQQLLGAGEQVVDVPPTLSARVRLLGSTKAAKNDSNDTPGRVFCQRKLTEGKSKKEALQALKRRISDAVWRQLQVDLKLR